MNRNRNKKQANKHVVPITHVYDKNRPTKPFKPQLYSKMADWVFEKEAKKKHDKVQNV